MNKSTENIIIIVIKENDNITFQEIHKYGECGWELAVRKVCDHLSKYSSVEPENYVRVDGTGITPKVHIKFKDEENETLIHCSYWRGLLDLIISNDYNGMKFGYAETDCCEHSKEIVRKILKKVVENII